MYPFAENNVQCFFLDNEQELVSYYSQLSLEHMDALLINVENIPYYKYSIQNGIGLATSNEHKKDLLRLCKSFFYHYEFDNVIVTMDDLSE
jgi:hypothetical protein